MRRRAFLGAVAAAATAGLAGCGYRAGPGDPRWSTELVGAPVAVRTVADGSAPVLVAGRDPDVPQTTFGFPAGQVAALDPATGEERWSYVFDVEVTAVGRGPPVAGRPVPVGLETGTVGLLRSDPAATPPPPDDPDPDPDPLETPTPGGEWPDDTGVRARRLAEFDDPVMAVVTDGTRFYVDVGGSVVAVDRDGTTRWEVSAPGDADERSLVPARRGVLIAVPTGVTARGREGSRRWRRTATPVGPPTAPPRRAGDRWLLPCERGLAALGPDGRRRWHVDLGSPIGGRPAVDGDRAFVATLETMDAVGLGDGRLRWRHETTGTTAVGPPTALDGHVFARFTDGTVAAVAGGTVQWQASLDGLAADAVPDAGVRVSGRSLVVGTVEGVGALSRPRTDRDPFPYI
jgi:outer membrane protein assembly factor BamB